MQVGPAVPPGELVPAPFCEIVPALPERVTVGEIVTVVSERMIKRLEPVTVIVPPVIVSLTKL
jgi:hypothetical protein